MPLLRSVERALFRAEMTVAVCCLAIIVVSMAASVTARYVFDVPLVWSAELCSLAQVWLTFIGASAVFKEHGHVALTGLTDALPRPLGRGIAFGCGLLVTATLVATAWYALQLIPLQNRQEIATLAAPRSLYTFPVIWAGFSMGFSAAMMLAFGRSAVAAPDGTAPPET